jgi:hypothetical protein
MRCPRCQGCFYTNCEQEQSCINCGFYLFPPDLPEALTMDPARWQSVLCQICDKPNVKQGREQCDACRSNAGHKHETIGVQHE